MSLSKLNNEMELQSAIEYLQQLQTQLKDIVAIDIHGHSNDRDKTHYLCIDILYRDTI